MNSNQIIEQAFPILPVIVIDEIHQAVPLATALREGGIKVFEVTLRTSCALQAIKAIKAALPDCITGAGTVTSKTHIKQLIEIGADFAVTPGATPELLEEASDKNLALVPGVCTPSEVIQAVSQGYKLLKFFPAEQAGGINMLKALSGPFPGIRFCPTGGIGPHNAESYLSLSNVCTVGGSWVCPKELVTAGDWQEITRLAQVAVKQLTQK